LDARLEALKRVAQIGLGVGITCASATGAAVLVVATANANGLAAYANVYWPGTVVVLILALFVIGSFEAGLYMLRNPDASFANVAKETALRRASTFAMVLLTSGVLLVLAALGIVWAAGRVLGGAEPTSETLVAGGTLLLYAIVRLVLLISRTDLGELARGAGIETAAPDLGETQRRFLTRLVIGFLLGIPLLDALIVFVAVALAPNDTRIYPNRSDATLVAALLWLIGIGAFSSGVTAWIRGRLPRARALVHAGVAVATLVPALVLDARVPLHPIIAGIVEQARPGAAASTPGPTIAAPLATPVPNATVRRSTAVAAPPTAAARTATASPPPPPGAPTISGLVHWGLTPIAGVRVNVTAGGRVVTTATTDAFGQYRATVLSVGNYQVFVDMTSVPSDVFLTSTSSGTFASISGPNTQVTYPTLTLIKRISVLQPAYGAVLTPPVVFDWWTVANETSYELVIRDDTLADPTTHISPIILSTRTFAPNLRVPSLASGHHYRWLVRAYLSAAPEPEVLIGESVTRLFSTP